METSELTYRGRSEREIFPEQRIHAKRGYADTTMSAASKLLNPTRFTLYRLQGRTGDDRQWRKYRQR